MWNPGVISRGDPRTPDTVRPSQHPQNGSGATSSCPVVVVVVGVVMVGELMLGVVLVLGWMVLV